MKRLTSNLLVAPALLLLSVFLAGPLALLVRVSLYEPAQGRGFYQPETWSLESYRSLVGDETFREVAGFTILAAMVITLLTLALAYPLALFIHHLSPRWRLVALSVVLVPKLCNVLVLVFGLQLLLSSAGPLSQAFYLLGVTQEPILFYRNRTGMVVGETYLLLPYAILLILLGLQRIDPSLIAAARGLGASRWQAFRRVTWPLSLPGVWAAGVLTLLWALSAVLGPLLLGGPDELTLGVEVQRQALEYHRWPRAAAVATLLVVVLLLAVVLGTRRDSS